LGPFFVFPKELFHKPAALSFIIFATMYNAYTQRYCTLQVTALCEAYSGVKKLPRRVYSPEEVRKTN
ncbi:hypothetical protein, partial [Escherichia coli]